MKTKIGFSYGYNTVFVDVARKIAKGEPPEWLLIGLDHFSSGLGPTPGQELRPGEFEDTIERMQRAATTLLQCLPAFQHLPFGLQCPDDVTLMLDALPRIIEDLERLNQKSKGRKPNMSREICAAIVVEAWRMVHGKAKPRSLQVYEACNDYWRACGCEEIGATGDIENWRRPVADAIATDHAWVRSAMKAVQNSP